MRVKAPGGRPGNGIEQRAKLKDERVKRSQVLGLLTTRTACGVSRNLAKAPATSACTSAPTTARVWSGSPQAPAQWHGRRKPRWRKRPPACGVLALPRAAKIGSAGFGYGELVPPAWLASESIMESIRPGNRRSRSSFRTRV